MPAEWWTREDLHRDADGRLIFAGIDVERLARSHDGPLFVYGADRIRANLNRLRGALDASGCEHRVYYAMKCNSFAPSSPRVAVPRYRAASGHRREKPVRIRTSVPS